MFTDQKRIRNLDRLLTAILEEGQTLERALQDPDCQKDADLAQRLREDVDTIHRLQALRTRLAPLPASVRAGRQRLVALISSQQTGWRSAFWWMHLDWSAGVALVVFLLFAATAQIIGQSRHAITIAMPGDSIYFLKIASEQVRLDLARSPEDRIRLHLTFAKNRSIEFESMILEERYDLLPQTLAGLESALGRARFLRNQVDSEMPVDIQDSLAELEKTVGLQIVMLQYFSAPLPAGLRLELERMAWVAFSDQYGVSYP